MGPSASGLKIGLGKWQGIVRLAAGRWFVAREVGRPQANLLSLVACVVLTIFLTKAIMVFHLFAQADLPPRLFDGRLVPALGRTAACCAEDAAVGLACLLLGGLALQKASARLIKSLFYLAALENSKKPAGKKQRGKLGK